MPGSPRRANRKGELRLVTNSAETLARARQINSATPYTDPLIFSDKCV